MATSCFQKFENFISVKNPRVIDCLMRFSLLIILSLVMLVSGCAPTTDDSSSDSEPRAVETKEEALSIAFQCLAYIGETIDLERDLVLVSEARWEKLETWQVMFLYREEKPLCECRERVVLEDGTVINPRLGFELDNAVTSFTLPN
jgi:hypothetical protein